MRKRNRFFGFQSITCCISMTLVLMLLGAVTFIVLFAYRASHVIKEEIAITLLLSDEATDSIVKASAVSLEAKPYVRKAEYHSSQEALETMKDNLGLDPSEFSGHNPFSAYFEVGLKADYANRDSIAWIAKELKKVPYVVDMEYQEELVDTLNDKIGKVSAILLTLAILLTMVSFTLINNTMRSAIYSRRFLIHTMKLVGAKWSFIRRPFLLNAMVLGLVSGILADAILLVGARSLVDVEPGIGFLVTTELEAMVGGAVLLFGLLIALLCAYFSVNNFLKMKLSRMYTA